MSGRPLAIALSGFAAILLAAGAAEARRKPAPTPTPAPEEPASGAVTTIPIRALPPPSPVEDGRPTVTALLLSSGLSPELESEALGVVADELGRDHRIHYVDATDLLEPPAHANAALVEADRLLDGARAAFDQMDMETARDKAERALAAYRRHLPVLGGTGGTSRVRDAWIRLAAVRFLDGNSDGARDALRHVFVYDPSIEYSAKLFPPQMKKAVVEGKLMMEALGAGKLTVESTPDGAAVWVNGTVRGLTPLTIDDAPSGPNHVTVLRTGYLPAAVDVEVSGGGEAAKASIELSRFDGDPWGAADEARPLLGGAVMPPSLVSAAGRLHAEMLIVFSSEKTGAGRTLTGWLYDARPKQLLRRAVRSGAEAKTAGAARLVAAELMRSVRLDGKLVAEKEEEPGPSLAERWASFRESSAFWPVAGVVGGVVIGGAAVGIAAGAGAFSHDTTQDAINQVILFGAQPRR